MASLDVESVPQDILDVGLIDGGTLITGCIRWEVLLHVSGWIVAGVLANGDGGIFVGPVKERETQRTRLLTEGPSYVVSMAHAATCLYIGIPNLSFVNAAPVDQYTQRNDGAEWMCANFIAYLIVDLAHVLWHWPKLGTWDTLIHHLSFLACGLIAGYHAVFVLPFTWLTLGETSTIFLNLRWFLLTTGRKSQSITFYVNLLFALSFFMTRIIVYGSGLLHMVYHRDLLLDIYNEKPSLSVVTILIVFGFVLNIVWFRNIFRKVSARFSSAASKEKET